MAGGGNRLEHQPDNFYSLNQSAHTACRDLTEAEATLVGELERSRQKPSAERPIPKLQLGTCLTCVTSTNELRHIEQVRRHYTDEQKAEARVIRLSRLQ